MWRIGDEKGSWNLSWSVNRSSAKRAVHVSSMADIVNHHKGGCEIHFIHDPTLSDPESIEPFSALQLGGLRWKWIGRQAVYAAKDTSDDGTRVDCGSFQRKA